MLSNPVQRATLLFWITAVVGLVVLIAYAVVLRFAPNLPWPHVFMMLGSIVVLVYLLLFLRSKSHSGPSSG
jgi:hypothetical protein